MKNLSIRLVFDTKNKAKSGVPGLIEIEIRIVGTSKKKYISTGVRLHKNQFVLKNGVFSCTNHENILKINSKVREKLRMISDFACSEQCTCLQDLDKIKKSEQICAQGQQLIALVENEIRIKSKAIEQNTLKGYLTLLNNLSDFGKMEYTSDLNYTNLVEFDKYLRSIQPKLKETTLYKRHILLKAIFRELYKKDLIEANPYEKFTFHKGRSKDPVYLTVDETKRISNWIPSSKVMEHIRDLFLFQCYTGLAYVDVCKFDRNKIIMVGNHEAIRSNRQKTDERFVSPLLPEAKEILEKYDYQLPIMTNQDYNRFLKVLAQFAQIDKKLTTHVGRHTFAMLLLNKGVPIEHLAVAMGHTKISTTQIYARIMPATAIDTILEKMKE